MPVALRLVLATALGATLLWSGLGWFDRHREAVDKAPTAAAPVPAPAAPPAVSEPRLPPATPDEIATLTAEPQARMAGLEALEARGGSPELVTAIDNALAVGAPFGAPTWWAQEAYERRLVCLRARVSGDDLLEFAVRWMPDSERSVQTDDGQRLTCLVKAIAASPDTSDQARDHLLPYVMSLSYERREAALRGLTRWDFDGLPQDVRDSLFSPTPSRRVAALRAAAALDGMAHSPEVFARGLADRDGAVWQAAKAAVWREPTPEGARMLALAVLEQPHGGQLLAFLRSDTRPLTLVWSACADIAADEAQPEELRARAVELLGLNSEMAHREAIASLTHVPSDLVRAAAEAALAEHDRRWR